MRLSHSRTDKTHWLLDPGERRSDKGKKSLTPYFPTSRNTPPRAFSLQSGQGKRQERHRDPDGPWTPQRVSRAESTSLFRRSCQGQQCAQGRGVTTSAPLGCITAHPSSKSSPPGKASGNPGHLLPWGVFSSQR